MMKKRLKSWTIACVVAVFFTSASRGEEVVYQTGFEEKEPVAYSGGSAPLPAELTPLSGERSFFADRTGSDAEFQMLLKTGLKLAGNAVYEAEFDYYIDEAPEGGHLFALFGSPTASWADSATACTTLRETGKKAHAVIRAVLTPVKNDYELMIFCNGKARVMIDDLRIRRVAVENTLENQAGKPELISVTGAPEVTVQPAANDSGVVVSVAEFGASPALADNSKAFADAMLAAKSRQAAKVIVPQGTYRFEVKWSALLFDRQRDLIFDGQGSHFIFYSEEKSPTYITVNGCERCEFRNFTMDWDFSRKPLYSRLIVRGIDREKGILDVEFPERNDVLEAKPELFTLMPIDNETGEAGRPNETYLFVEKAEFLSENTARLKMKNFNADCLFPQAGDHYMAVHSIWSGYAVRTENCSDLTFDNVAIYASPGFGFYFGGTDSVRVNGCKVVPNPDATPKRLLSTNSDAMDFLNCSRGGFLIENCEFSASGDDFINFNSTSYCGVKKIDAHTLVANTEYPDYSYFVGDRIELRNYDFSPTGYVSEITAREVLGPKEVKVTFRDPLPEKLEAQTILFILKNRMENIVIRNNYFHRGFCRGILPAARNVTIENNLFERNSMPDLLIVNDFLTRYRIEGNGISNLLIRDNTFRESNVCGMREASAAIYMPMWRPNSWFPISTAIRITGNKFESPNGAVLFSSSVNGLEFDHNEITFDGAQSGTGCLFRGNVVPGVCSANFYIHDNLWPDGGGVMLWEAGTRDIAVSGNQGGK